jgi:hypothetical protein
MKLEEDLADVQRKLQQKTANEHGEGAELELFEVLKAAFEGDRIRRVEKGTFENVILASPARVLSLAEILRRQIVVNHELRIGAVERDKKSAELYAFINSPLAGQLLDSVQSRIGKMDDLDADERKSHQKVWDKRAVLRQSVLRANGRPGERQNRHRLRWLSGRGLREHNRNRAGSDAHSRSTILASSHTSTQPCASRSCLKATARRERVADRLGLMAMRIIRRPPLCEASTMRFSLLFDHVPQVILRGVAREL